MAKVSKGIFDDRPVRIRFRGQYDYDGLLELLRGFFFRHQFDLYETKFKYKTGGSGSEVEFVFEGEKEVTQYLQVKMKIAGKIWDMIRTEAIIQGKPKLVSHGRLDFRITAEFIFDYGNRFGVESEKTQKKVEIWMENVLNHDPEGLQFYDLKVNGKKYLEKTVMAYADEIKTFLGMETMRKD